MRKHLLLLYLLIACSLVISVINLSSIRRVDFNNFSQRVAKIEFYQEATRVMNNLIGFDQVYASFSKNSDKIKQCSENQELLKEWQDDINSLQNLDTDFVSHNEDAKFFLNSIKTLYDTIGANCSKLGK